MKLIKIFIAAVITAFFLSSRVHASVVDASDSLQLQTYLTSGEEIKLTNDITISENTM